jgi:hypothetical protein
MLRDCWSSVRSSYQNATAALILRRLALVYLPTICVISVFVALTWLGLSMNNQTFRNKNLVVVITYFAALLVLECILLAHVVIRRQRTARLSQKPSYVDSSTQTVSTTTNDNGGSPLPTVENLDHVSNRPRPQVPQASAAEVMAGRPQEPEPPSENVRPPMMSLHRPSLPPSQRVPALCQPYHPSPIPEITRPTTAAAYISQPSLPAPQIPSALRSSWDLTMASDNHPRISAQPPTSEPLPTPLLQAQDHIKPFAKPASSKPTERHPTPSIPETRPLQSHNHISALPTNAPPRHRPREMHRASPGARTPQKPQPQPQPHPSTQQSHSQSHSHSSLLEKNLIALAGT